jgi:hypothetical protein
VLAINIAWWRADDPELLERIVASVRTAFPSVYTVTGISEQSGAVLLAGGDDASPDNLVPSALAAGHAGLAEIVHEVTGGGPARLAKAAGGGRLLTDDCAPVGRIADRCYRRLRQQAYDEERQAVSP